MPIKVGKKKYKTFTGAVKEVMREGHTKAHAERIVGYLENKQHPKRRRRS